ncbi:ODC1 [Ictidomys tridecemlineatus]|uniref:Ornithine decarboxylase n=1 Tax=Ictidomys tridecemlineatus TaxID=43179 RepID=A0A287DC12_ICTTR|nr:ODC1 [Ictidomys tridecemlineatus]
MNNFSNEEFDCHFLDEGFTAKDILDQKINKVSSSDDKDAFYVLKALPHVTPFYAVKCNESRAIMKTLAAIESGFDCASKTEIQLVQSLRVPPERIIYANLCKHVSQIKYAASIGVQMMTFDSEVELMKVARAHPKAKLVLRIATDDFKAVCRLSVKFGATLKTSRLPLERAKELNIDVIGVSFHAISDARCVFDMGAEAGFSMCLLDIGGGFPGSEDVKLKFEEITSVISPALDKYFPSDSGVRIIAEPGRYYVVSAFMLAVNIIAKKLTGSDDEDEASEQTFMYYVNDRPLLQKRPKPDEKYYSSSIWRPTCGGLDRIVKRCDLPEMHVDSVRYYHSWGCNLKLRVQLMCQNHHPGQCCGSPSELPPTSLLVLLVSCRSLAF